jgi:ATP phosphoribosyltransferase
VLESQALLIANPAAMGDKVKRKMIDRLLIRVRGSQEANGKRYLMMNAPVDSVEKLKRVIPSLKSPTVVPLAESGMVAIHSVVAENVFWDVMEKLKQAGSSDIIVVPSETIIR